jgi:hypothetical protein
MINLDNPINHRDPKEGENMVIHNGEIRYINPVTGEMLEDNHPPLHEWMPNNPELPDHTFAQQKDDLDAFIRASTGR